MAAGPAPGRAGPPACGFTPRAGGAARPAAPGRFRASPGPFVRRGGLPAGRAGACHGAGRPLRPSAAGERRFSGRAGSPSPGREQKGQRGSARAPPGGRGGSPGTWGSSWAGPGSGRGLLCPGPHRCRGEASPRRRGAPALQPSPPVETRPGGDAPPCPACPRPCVWWPEGSPSVGRLLPGSSRDPPPASPLPGPRPR